jgi:hypothetical protein
MKIHEAVYTSQKGNTSAGKDIDLSLLRTCKQIYEEGKDLVWKHNVFPFGLEALPRLHLNQQYRIMHVKIHTSLCGCPNGSVDFGEAIRAFGDWSRGGSLRSVTIQTMEPI